jgi:hypothetical protein
LADFLLFLGLPFINESANIPKSVTGTHIWKILSSELRFGSAIEKVDKSVMLGIELKSEYFLKFPQQEYDDLDFEKKLKFYLKGFRRNIVQRLYDRHSAVVWIIGTFLAAGATAAAILALPR